MFPGHHTSTSGFLQDNKRTCHFELLKPSISCAILSVVVLIFLQSADNKIVTDNNQTDFFIIFHLAQFHNHIVNLHEE